MTLPIDTINQACETITRQVREVYRPLTLRFIAHHDGQMTEALKLTAQDILSHPAAETAINIMRRKRETQQSDLLGTAVARHNRLFGLVTRDTALALCTINADDFENLNEIRREAYHIAWHAIDAFRWHEKQDKEQGSSFALKRHRTGLEIAAANLQADAFSALMNDLQGDSEAIMRLAYRRGLEALDRHHRHMPEYYPFIIAMEATQFAAQRLHARNVPKKKLLPAAWQAAHEINRAFEDALQRQWVAFSKPAQEMAWRDFDRDEILSAAINTSQNTYVRAAGYMIAEVARIRPAPLYAISESYSPFADTAFNQKLHRKMMERTFDVIAAEGVKRGSGAPFAEEMERQNRKLTEGHIMGWCGSALQEAARGFDNAIAQGSAAALQAAQRAFNNEKERTSWESLCRLSRALIRHIRNEGPLLLATVVKIAENEAGLSRLKKAVEVTLQQSRHRPSLGHFNSLQATPPAQTVPVAARFAPVIGGMAPGGARIGGKATGFRHMPPPAERGED